MCINTCISMTSQLFLTLSSCAFLFSLPCKTDDDCSFNYLRSSADAGYHDMSSLTPPNQPSLPWRIGSSVTIGAVGAFCRTFLYGLNDSQVVGLDRFLKVLEERRDVGARTRGLLTGTGLWRIPQVLPVANKRTG